MGAYSTARLLSCTRVRSDFGISGEFCEPADTLVLADSMVIVNSPAWLPVAASWDWALVTAAFWLGMSPGLTSANTRRTVSRPAVVCRTAAVRFARSTPALIWLTRKMPINSTPTPVTTTVVAPTRS